MDKKLKLQENISHLLDWIKDHDYKSYDPFDGLKSPLVKYILLNNKYLRIVWQQFFKRCPINLRPIVGIKESIIPKTMGNLASANLLLYKLHNDKQYLDKAISYLNWLKVNYYRGYPGYCWGVGFNYQSRGIYAKKGIPNIVTTFYCANAFLDFYELIRNSKRLEIARSSCNFILKGLGTTKIGDTLCINYYPIQRDQIHNANMFGAVLLSRVYKYTKEKYLLKFANKAVRYTINNQKDDGAWFYGEGPMYRWIDNFHTGYILESLYNYINYTDCYEFMPNLLRGIDFYKRNFFLSDGSPKYYNNKLFPIDIQCVAQAIQTFAILSNIEKKYLDLSIKIAKWAIKNMRDDKGYFYYRKYKFFINKIPYIRWGQSTMLLALTYLLRTIKLNKINSEIK